jgi:hypothetical protein
MLHQDQVTGGFAMRVRAQADICRRARDQKLAQPAGIGDMHGAGDTIHPHRGAKAVIPAHEFGRGQRSKRYGHRIGPACGIARLA